MEFPPKLSVTVKLNEFPSMVPFEISKDWGPPPPPRRPPPVKASVPVSVEPSTEC